MRGKVCVVTGASGGIGRETARGLARQGATAVLVVRSRERGEAARGEILRTLPQAEVHLVLADLSLMAQVRRAAEEIGERFGRVDALVNNAAVYTPKRTETAEGIETQLAVNHLAPFLLTNLLLGSLKASAPARVVTMSSGAHHSGRIRWDDLQARHKYGGLRRYSDTKLMNVLFTTELARRMAGTGVTANAMHPGVVGTELLFGGFAPLRLFRRFLRTPEQGAATAVWLASSPEVERVTGRYFKDEKEAPTSSAARDAEAARRLWEESERLVGLG